MWMRMINAHSKAAGQADILRADGKGGRHFNLSWKTGNELPACCWTHLSSNDNPETAHLSTRVMDFLSHNCLPRMQRRQLQCFTMFTDGKGNKYRAHPCYDSIAWNKKLHTEYIIYSDFTLQLTYYERTDTIYCNTSDQQYNIMQYFGTTIQFSAMLLIIQ